MDREGRSSHSLNVDTFPGQSPATNQSTEGAIASDIEVLYQSILNDTHNIEKRFPVDRRKLERLIIAGKDNETAEGYFERIMKSTDTVILWPSKLKIGAKSKKDPQVKVAGLPVNVNKARDMILEELDTKCNRVTLKINVSSIEHSHVIGKEGANIKKVHQDTLCHIHFPDSNRPNQHGGSGERSDQVSITGLVPAVEIARVKVRELQPITLSFSLPLPGHMTVDSQSHDMLQISETYNVVINIKSQPQHLSMLITLKSTMKLIDGLKLAIAKITEYFTGDYCFIPQVTLYCDIAQSHQRTVMGMDGGNLHNIMHDTCTTIHFPDPKSRYHISQLSIVGTIDNVLEARQRLMGCLPIALLFDVTDEGENITSSYIGELMQSMDIFICLKPKAKQYTNSVIIKSIEQNMDCVYESRQKILELASCTTTVSSPHYTTSPTIDTIEESHTEPNDIPEDTLTDQEPRSTTKRPSIPTVDISTPLLSPPTVCVQTPPQTGLEQTIHETESTAMSGGSGRLSQGKITVRTFLDYEKKKEKAEVARKSKVEPDVPRYPTNTFSGEFFSRSMPPVPRDTTKPMSTPRGLDSISRSNFALLMKQANNEREETISNEQNMYKNIKDLSSLLIMLGLEKYETNFAEEEVDFETFLTMSEDDLKEVGVTTLGARRKLQIAIAELRKLRSDKTPAASTLGATSSGRQHNVQSFLQSVKSQRQSQGGGVRLAPPYINMSHSVRF